MDAHLVNSSSSYLRYIDPSVFQSLRNHHLFPLKADISEKEEKKKKDAWVLASSKEEALVNEWPMHETSGHEIRVDHYRMEARTARRPLSSSRQTDASVLHAVSCCGGAPTKSRPIVLAVV